MRTPGDKKEESAPPLEGSSPGRKKKARLSSEHEKAADEGKPERSMPQRPESAKKQKTARSAPRPRVAGPGSPLLPWFAFEWFRASQSASECEHQQSLPDLVNKWKDLTGDERKRYLNMAKDDRDRFDSEYAEWKARPLQHGTEEPRISDLMDQRKNALERKLARADRQSQRESQPQAQKRTPKPKLPPGHPVRSRSAYAIFCKDQAAKLRGAQEAAGDPAMGDVEGGARPEGVAGRGANLLVQLRKAWKELPREERLHYEALAAQDSERFQEEFEAWRGQHPDHGLGEPSRPRLPRPRVPPIKQIDLAKANPSEVRMDDILVGAALVGFEEEREERRRRAKEAKEAQLRKESRGNATPRGAVVGDASEAGRGSAARPAAHSEHADPGSWASGGGQGGAGDSTWQDGPLPVPQGAPAMMRPDTVVDDLLGDLVLAESQHDEDEQGEVEDDFNGGALLPREGLFDPPAAAWSDTPEVMGAPRVLGPQVRLDESGNFVLDHSSLTQCLDQERPLESNGPVRESVSQYTSAYRKTPACKWSDDETDMFYEALALYGTDLFLVQTFFRNKSAAQIKTKYSKELRKSPARVEEALTTRVQRLTKDTFERLHGKIDTSKHYRPPASPPPGEDREPDGPAPAEERPPPEAETPPPEPEYSAEDESLTTNRLMALFD